jgi:6-phosphogluconate dehydrogenase
MELAIIGLGRMGGAMAQRLLNAGHQVVAFDQDRAAAEKVRQYGARTTQSLHMAVESLRSVRVVWIMVPAGDAVDRTIKAAVTRLEPGDVIMDGGNSNYKDSQRRAEALRREGIHFVDVGTSGGVWGAKFGYSLMIGGDEAVVETLRPIFEALAPSPSQGWARLGPVGAGHFAKMVHNGIEYGLMQAYAEGFALLENKKEFSIDLAQTARVWQHGSVVRSWLLDLTAEALSENRALEGVAPYVADSGEGRWMVFEAVSNDVPCPVITAALLERIRSRYSNSFANRLLSVMRNKFGGHVVKSASDPNAS